MTAESIEKFVIRVRETPDRAADLVIEARDERQAIRFAETVCDTTNISGMPSAYDNYVRPYMEEDPHADGELDPVSEGLVDWDDPQLAKWFGFENHAPHFDFQEVCAFVD